MTESGFWGRLQPKLSPYGQVERIENRLGGGTPDVNYCLLRIEGWFELKMLDRWPAQSATPVMLPHFTLDQYLWHKQRHEAGGRTCLIAQVHDEYFLFAPWNLKPIYQGAPRQQFTKLASVHGRGSIPARPFIRWLVGKDPASRAPGLGISPH